MDVLSFAYSPNETDDELRWKAVQLLINEGLDSLKSKRIAQIRQEAFDKYDEDKKKFPEWAKRFHEDRIQKIVNDESVKLPDWVVKLNKETEEAHALPKEILGKKFPSLERMMEDSEAFIKFLDILIKTKENKKL